MSASMLGPLVAGAVLLSSCAIAESETVFDRRLVREVGNGSVALQGYEEFVAHALNYQSVYGPAENRTMERLLRGRIFKVSDADLNALLAAADEGETGFERELRGLRSAEQKLRAAEISEAQSKEFGDDTRDFLEAWNAYLLANADELGVMADVLGEGHPLFARNEQLVAAARRAQTGGSLAAYDRVRRKTLDEVVRMVRTFDRLQAPETTKAEQRVADIYNDSTDARALVSAVNKKYPDGYLASRVGEREDR